MAFSLATSSGGNFFPAHGQRNGGGHLHGQVLGRGYGLRGGAAAAQLQHDADLAAVVDVGHHQVTLIAGEVPDADASPVLAMTSLR